MEGVSDIHIVQTVKDPINMKLSASKTNPQNKPQVPKFTNVEKTLPFEMV